MSVISPDLHRAFSLPFGQAVCKTAHKFNKAVQYHMCGKSRQSLPITAEMGVDGFDALECAPTGNVDLAEVKRTFGAKISLRGNVNSIYVMGNGTAKDVEQAAKNCLDSAKAGGGYILAVGDQTPANTPEENLFALVETGRKFGKY
jgi:uroporphyrinogen decarboxylase